jgi:hypothetical protein
VEKRSMTEVNKDAAPKENPINMLINNLKEFFVFISMSGSISFIYCFVILNNRVRGTYPIVNVLA